MSAALQLLNSKIESATIDLPEGGKRKYRRLLVTADEMRAFELNVNDAHKDVPILVVPGTSISFSEAEGFLAWLLCHGYPVAFIENPIGSPFDIGIHPKRERPIILEHFLDHLQRLDNLKVEKVIGLFQSYAAFDAIRLISKNPLKFRNFMPVFFLDNPAGFNGPINMFAHILRWQVMHVIGGFIKYALSGFWSGAYPIPLNSKAREDYKRRERHGLWVWWKNTLKNPVRGGVRELLDICQYRAENDMQKILEAGYTVGMFKHSDDRVLPIYKTLKYSQNLFADKILVFDGGHNDLFVQQKNWQQIADAMHTRNKQEPILVAESGS